LLDSLLQEINSSALFMVDRFLNIENRKPPKAPHL